MRPIIGIVRASKIQHQLCAIMLFALPLPTRLNEALCLDIANEAFFDQAIVMDLIFNTNILSSGASTYRRKEMESMLGYVDKNSIVYAT